MKPETTDRELLERLNSNICALIEILTYDTGRDTPKDWVSVGETLTDYRERTAKKASPKKPPRRSVYFMVNDDGDPRWRSYNPGKPDVFRYILAPQPAKAAKRKRR